MRSRNLKPGFFKNEELAECSVEARLCFAGLWLLADREGRLEDRPKRIKAELFPFDDFPIEPLLAQLAAHRFILRYEVDGRRYIQIRKFKLHQSPHYSEKQSGIKAPELPEIGPHIGPSDSGSAPGGTPGVGPPSRGPRNPLIPDSLIPDSLIPDSPTASPPVKTRAARESPPPKPEEERPKAVAAVTQRQLEADGLSAETAAEWLAHRRAKKAPLTPRAWEGIKAEARKARWPVEQAVCKALARGWTGFEAEWVRAELASSNGNGTHRAGFGESAAQRAARERVESAVPSLAPRSVHERQSAAAEEVVDVVAKRVG